MLSAWRERMSASAYRHEGGAHPDIACTDCHVPAKMNTVDVQTLRVPVSHAAAPKAAILRRLWTKAEFLNYEIDQKKEREFCLYQVSHSFCKQSVPASHVSAISKPTK